MNESGAKAARRAAIAIAVFLCLTAALFWLDPANFYLWAKAIHVIAIISWMAGMVYLPRLFVYHCEAEKGSVQSETFKVMERRLLRVIINPAMTIAWVFGLWLAWQAGYFTQGWFHVKLLGVVLLSACHGYLSRGVRLFAEDRNEKSQRHWRLVNEIPTVLMILIVVMVIVKPF
ncbi:MAG: protoporphyrinogen oxidase HemJ [Notoacmeibacter sp.]|nr:protoporphyrinogen oxidase HemJ [Notoacmeibacter sp.]MCC0033517.1 protoporphyrinogen oxidase HemJ [Brucellaceae bacterium]